MKALIRQNESMMMQKYSDPIFNKDRKEKMMKRWVRAKMSIYEMPPIQI